MRSFTILATLVAFFAASASSQQYAGEVIENSLPNVPGSEVAFFNIPRKGTQKHTLINYYSHGKDGKRLVESKVQRAVIVVHGLNRDPMTYQSNMMSALAQVTGDPNINKDTVAIMAPYFPNGDDKGTGYPWTEGLAAGRGSTTSALVWKGSQWAAGGDNQYPWNSKSTSSYMVLDTIIKYFDDKSLFPNMKQIVIAGHSLGAQTVQRYAALGQQLNTQSPVTYWIGNPNSYVWLSTDRPLSTATCPTYDDYREGYNQFTEYPMTYGQSLVSQGRSAILANYQSKQIAYARGTKDNGDDSSSCAPMTTGSNRNERFFNFIKAFPASCDDPRGANCDTVDFVNMGHDGGGMFASAAGKARLFTDNFYGNGNRSYDFGYPRQQAGDDPFPDPALNSTTSSVDSNTYAGNMTYAGCWSDAGQSRTFTVQAYDNQANTIDLCTTTCASRGYSLAGVEFGSQCYCGNFMTAAAVKVIESSCKTPCAGNSSQSCGGTSRLSVFSNGTPNVLAPASNPETVGKFYYSNCFTDSSNPRTLSGPVVRGNSITLEYCANFCSDYKYFGTEYSTECFCGNSINSAASIATSGECGMTCANDTSQFCGGSSRLSLYTNPDWVQPTGSSTSSAASNPTASSGASGPACPASDGTVVTSKNGLNFTVECGIDHAGGDLAFQYVSSFQECIDACSSNSQCVDVSLSGTACYLKKSVGPVVKISGVWGAKLLVDGTSSSTSTTSATGTGSSTLSSSSLSTTSVTSTSATSVSSGAPTSSPSVISCPASDGTTYTGASGQSFIIECGIDHQAGDMGNKYVNTFQECIDVCDQTAGCVDVSLSGTACYLKKTLGAAVKAPSIWGAKLVTSSVSSSQSSSTSSSSTSISSSATGSSTLSDSTVTSSSTSSGASVTPTTVSCPASNDNIYTVASGQSFLIECGIDHQGGDLSSNSVKSFVECIELCGTTPTCVDVSMSGDMCYLKSSVGSVVKLDWVWGAKLIEASASSVSSTTSSTSTDLVSSSASSVSSTVSSTSTDLVSSSASSSSSASLDSSSSSVDTVSSSSTSSIPDSSASNTSSSSASSTGVSSLSSDSTSSSSASDSSLSTSSASSSVATTSSEQQSSSTLTESTLSSSSVSSTAAQTTSSSSSESSISTESTTVTSSTSTSVVTSESSTSSVLDTTSSSADSTLSTSSSATSSSSVSSITSSSAPSSTVSELSSTSSTQSGESLTSSSITSSSSDSSITSSSITTSSTVSETSTTSSTQFSESSASSSISSSSQTTSSTVSEPTAIVTSSTSSSKSSSSIATIPSTTSTSSSTSSGFSTSTFSTTSSVPASTSSTSLPAGFSYSGCFVDGSKRVLPVSAGTSSTQTQQQCAMTCQDKGYKYSGTEYGNECWCGNTLPSSSAPEFQCSKACSGDKTQKCGGGNRLSVVSDDSWKQSFFARENFESWNLMGCYMDSTSKRSLPTSVSLAAYGGGSKATIANCMQACQARGFTYCGAEYYAECYGSNVAPATDLASGSDPLSAGCNYPCKGNSTESCGGSARIIVYTTLGGKE